VDHIAMQLEPSASHNVNCHSVNKGVRKYSVRKYKTAKPHNHIAFLLLESLTQMTPAAPTKNIPIALTIACDALEASSPSDSTKRKSKLAVFRDRLEIQSLIAS
jgi:hypothetical protein